MSTDAPLDRLPQRQINFSQALIALKQGEKLTRVGWNAPHQFVYLVPAASYAAQTPAAKERFGEMVPYRAYFALVTAQNDVATWQPTPSDVLADDWKVLR